MPKFKLTDEQRRELFEDYDKWQKFAPDSESADELATRHGVSKATLYNLLDRRQRGEFDGNDTRSPPGGEDLAGVVRYLTDELIRARVRIAELERQLEQP